LAYKVYSSFYAKAHFLCFLFWFQGFVLIMYNHLLHFYKHLQTPEPFQPIFTSCLESISLALQRIAFCPADADRCHSAKIIANVLESGRVEFIYSHYMPVRRRAQDSCGRGRHISIANPSRSVCFLIQFVFTATAAAIGTDNAPLVNNDVIRRYLAPDIGRRRPAASRIKLYESPGGFCMRYAMKVWQEVFFFCLCIGRRRSCKKRHAFGRQR
jgi:hypothetical protein